MAWRVDAHMFNLYTQIIYIYMKKAKIALKMHDLLDRWMSSDTVAVVLDSLIFNLAGSIWYKLY